MYGSALCAGTAHHLPVPAQRIAFLYRWQCIAFLYRWQCIAFLYRWQCIALRTSECSVGHEALDCAILCCSNLLTDLQMIPV